MPNNEGIHFKNYTAYFFLMIFFLLLFIARYFERKHGKRINHQSTNESADAYQSCIWQSIIVNNVKLDMLMFRVHLCHNEYLDICLDIPK